MGQIKVNTSELREYADSLSKLAGRLDNVQYLLNNTFDRAVLSTKKLANGQKLDTAASRLRKCQSFLNGVADDFSNAESYLTSFDPLSFSAHDVIHSSNVAGANAVAEMISNQKAKVGASIEVGSVSTSASFEATYKNSLEKEIWDEKPKSKSHLRIKAKVSAEVSAVKGSVSGECDWASGAAEYKALNAEAHASVEAGLYSEEVDENGKVRKVFSPQVKAEVGVSVSVFEASAEGKIGNKYIGANGEVEFKPLSAEAKAKLKLSPKEVSLKASAEADLVKVGGTAGLSVFGSDVATVGANFKIGAGAHADVKYKDGKIKCDVGAALGFGFDISFEVDVKGTVKAVSKAASSAWGGIKSGYKSAKKAFKGVVKFLF